MARRKTNPDHKMLTVSMGFHANCSCGWVSSTYYGRGSRSEAVKEWHIHREKCEAQT